MAKLFLSETQAGWPDKKIKTDAAEKVSFSEFSTAFRED
jgi:hypothetical protein